MSLQAQQDRAYRRIKAAIVRCALAPGRAVSEVELATRYRVGRASIRAALLRLRQEKMVRAVPRRGYVIGPVTLKDVQDIFEIRLMLEPQAARLAAGSVDAERLRRLDDLCCAGYRPGDIAGISAFLRANSEFHVTIARATENERLAEMLGQLLLQMERFFHLGLSVRDRTLEIQHEHRALVEALARGDGQAAERIAAEQIEAARKMVLEGIFASRELSALTLREPGDDGQAAWRSAKLIQGSRPRGGVRQHHQPEREKT